MSIEQGDAVTIGTCGCDGEQHWYSPAEVGAILFTYFPDAYAEFCGSVNNPSMEPLHQCLQQLEGVPLRVGKNSQRRINGKVVRNAILGRCRASPPAFAAPSALPGDMALQCEGMDDARAGAAASLITIRQRGLAEVLREANAFTAPTRHTALEAALVHGALPMRVSFQETLGLKSASSTDLARIIHRLCEGDSMGGVGVLMLNGLPGLRGSGCMRALVRLLAANPQVFSLNLGEQEGFFLTAEDHDILVGAVEAGCTGLALGWLEHSNERFFAAINHNRQRLQRQARAIYAATGHAASALRRIPWRDGAYRDRLTASRPDLSEYTALGQHHVWRTQLQRWTERELKE